MKIRLSSRDSIIEAAFQLYSEDPAASLAEIAERAGIGRATLHRHFKGRDELMEELVVVALREMDTCADAASADAESCTEALRCIMDAMIPLANRHWFLSREPWEKYPAAAAEIERQNREMYELVEEVRSEGTIANDVPVVWIVEVLDNLVFAAWEMVGSGHATPAQASEWAWRTFTRGLGTC